jgi:H+/Cl- antiporter ClcA
MKTRKISKVYATLANWRKFQFRLFGEGIVVGACSGLIIVGFRYALEMAESLRSTAYSRLSAGDWLPVGLWFLVLFFTAFILHRIVAIEPMSAGSGIPQVKGTILGVMRMHWLKILVGKFVGGVLAIGAGLSLGREGPSVQLGAVIGQGFSRLSGRTRMEERYLITSGASAGLAAAFNAPLAGVIFSLEELHKNFSSAVLLPAIAAALTADVISQYFFGPSPIFQFMGLPILPARYYLLVILLGLIVGAAAVPFNRGLVFALDFLDRQTWATGMGKAALALFTAGVLGFFLPDILGGGNELVNKLAVAPMSLSLLLLLLVAKFLFTMLSYGSGVPGGIFLPLLVVGALTGAICGDLYIQFGLLEAAYRTNIIILAMAAYFSAVVKSPVTGSILIMEMTGSFNHMLPLIIVSITAYLIADLAKTGPIYEDLLARSLNRQGRFVAATPAEKRQVIELPVCMGSKLDGKFIRDIEWPPDCLLVSIRRGDHDLVPKGDARMMVGDYLFVLTPSEHLETLRRLAE